MCMSTKRTLLFAVDDSAVSRKALESVCRSGGYDVRSFAGAQEAMSAFAVETPDIVVTDLVMPVIDGIEFLGWIRARRSLDGIPVIVVSSATSSKTLESALDSGAFDYVRKPYDSAEILARLKSALRYAEAMARLRHAATHDSLTGLANHAELMRELEEGAREACRGQDAPRAFSFLMIDIDHFKKVNDNHGHQAGDKVLKLVSHLIRKAFPGLISGRYGGEEFGILLPGYDKAMAVKTAEAFLALVSKTEVEGLPDLTVTVSAGVATVSEGVMCDLNCLDTVEKLVKKADEELYRAKREGRNRVCS